MVEKYTETQQGIISAVLSSFSLSCLFHTCILLPSCCSNNKILFRSQLCVYVRNVNHIRGAVKSLARPGRKPRRRVRDACDFNNIETRGVIKFFFLQGKALKEIHAILRETSACFLPGQAKDLPAPLYAN